MPHTCHEGEDRGMVIALLAVLGVDLIVIVVLLGAVLARRRWVSHQPGTFKGAILRERSASSTARYRGWDPRGSAAMAAGSVTCSSGPRRRRCSGTSWWRSTGLPEKSAWLRRVRSSGWEANPWSCRWQPTVA